jgi:hypothetical protein
MNARAIGLWMFVKGKRPDLKGCLLGYDILNGRTMMTVPNLR